VSCWVCFFFMCYSWSVRRASLFVFFMLFLIFFVFFVFCGFCFFSFFFFVCFFFCWFGFWSFGFFGFRAGCLVVGFLCVPLIFCLFFLLCCFCFFCCIFFCQIRRLAIIWVFSIRWVVIFFFFFILLVILMFDYSRFLSSFVLFLRSLLFCLLLFLFYLP